MMLLNPLIYIAFSIFLQLLVGVKSQTEIFKPDLRRAHTATLIDNKLYILGGAIPPGIKTPKETFFYLDVSVPFNTNELKWSDLSATTKNIIPPHQYATTIKGGANNNTLFLYGGERLMDGAMALVHTYNTQSNLWRAPEITGMPPAKTMGVTLVIDYNELIYIFGGYSNSYTSDMFVLDSINLNWKRVSSINAPSPRAQYGAVFLPNKNIIYMGGFNMDLGVFPLNEVYLYDTTNDIWTRKTTNGLSPSPRSSFTTVLGLDGQRVILFGGVENNSTLLSPENSLYVLDLNDFNWYVPKVTGNIPSSRAFHKTVLIEKYMVVTFGLGYTQGVESDILLLDINNNDEYTWITSFEPPPASSKSPIPTSTMITQPSTIANAPSPSSPLSQSNNTEVIVCSFIGSLVGGILLAVGCFFLYRRYRNTRKPIVIRIAGENNGHDQKLQHLVVQAVREELRASQLYVPNNNRIIRTF